MKILYLPNCYSQQRQRQKQVHVYPILLAMQATWYARQGHKIFWNKLGMKDYDKLVIAPEDIPFTSLPPADRVLTDAFNPIYQNNGNFKYHPGTYIQVANGCWWGQCTFCVERKNKWEVRNIHEVQRELWDCHVLGFKEVFDDSGTFPTGEWLDTFCRLELPPIKLGCNMRMVDVNYGAMKRAGFRMLLFGLESANQKTLNKINKGTSVDDVKYIVKAAKAGLDCHAAVMFSYPWESDEDALRTLHLVHWLLKKGYVRTAQASFYTLEGEQGQETQRKYLNKIYAVAYSPEFWFNQLRKIENLDDIKYIWRGIKEGIKGYGTRKDNGN